VSCVEFPPSFLSKSGPAGFIHSLMVANEIACGDLVYYQPYNFAHWQGAVVAITNIQADARKEIDARAVFAHIDGCSKDGWKRHCGPAHLNRSDIRSVYRSDRTLDADALNSKNLFATMWHQVEPDTVTFVPGRHDVIEPNVIRVQRKAHLLKQNHPSYASMIHDFGGASECTAFVSSFTCHHPVPVATSHAAASGGSPSVSMDVEDLTNDSDGSVRSSCSNLCCGKPISIYLSRWYV
jgi:hypothetical protein